MLPHPAQEQMFQCSFFQQLYPKSAFKTFHNWKRMRALRSVIQQTLSLSYQHSPLLFNQSVPFLRMKIKPALFPSHMLQIPVELKIKQKNPINLCSHLKKKKNPTLQLEREERKRTVGCCHAVVSRVYKSETATWSSFLSSQLWIRFLQAVGSASCCLSKVSFNTAASSQKTSYLLDGNIPPQRNQMRDGEKQEWMQWLKLTEQKARDKWKNKKNTNKTWQCLNISHWFCLSEKCFSPQSLKASSLLSPTAIYWLGCWNPLPVLSSGMLPWKCLEMCAPLRDENLKSKQQEFPQPPVGLQHPTIQPPLPVAIVMQKHIQLPPRAAVTERQWTNECGGREKKRCRHRQNREHTGRARKREKETEREGGREGGEKEAAPARCTSTGSMPTSVSREESEEMQNAYRKLKKGKKQNSGMCTDRDKEGGWGRELCSIKQGSCRWEAHADAKCRSHPLLSWLRPLHSIRWKTTKQGG